MHEKNFFIATATEYTTTPTGKPDLKRALERRSDYWKLTVNQKEFKKKKIIISDWLITYAESPSESTFFRLKLWRCLLDTGFEIYVWNTQGLQKIDNKQKLSEALNNV